jgi:hypothetical protein
VPAVVLARARARAALRWHQLVSTTVALPMLPVAVPAKVVATAVAQPELQATEPEVVLVEAGESPAVTAPGAQVSLRALVPAPAAVAAAVPRADLAVAVASVPDPAALESTRISLASRSKLQMMEPSISVSPFWYPPCN